MMRDQGSNIPQSSLVSKRNPFHRATLVLIGTMLLSFALGSVHAFSVLQPVIEQTFDTSRTSASLTYSLALISLAFTVFLGYRAYAKLSPPLFVVGIGFIAALGCFIAGFSGSVFLIWFGFSLLFGGANGLGYGYALQLSAQAMPTRKGFAMGAVTAAYALGAVSFPIPLNIALDMGGWTTAMILLSASILIISAISAALLARSRMIYEIGSDTTKSTGEIRWQVVVLLWLTFGCAVTAGLMAIGHATGIAKAAVANAHWVVASPIIIAFANMIGSLLCGVLLDRLPGRLILVVLGILSSSALMAMAILPQTHITMLGLAIIGFSYGGTISVYPAYISNLFGAANGAIIFGRVFTAWAVAGLFGPVSAGLLFDLYQNYSTALIVATAVGILSLLLLSIPFQSDRPAKPVYQH